MLWTKYAIPSASTWLGKTPIRHAEMQCRCLSFCGAKPVWSWHVHQGWFQTVYNCKVRFAQGIPAPAEAKAETLLEALKWIHQMNMQNIIVEIDCKDVVDTLLSDSLHFSELEHIVMMCNKKLSHLKNA